jgi:hypothetical protein
MANTQQRNKIGSAGRNTGTANGQTNWLASARKLGLSPVFGLIDKSGKLVISTTVPSAQVIDTGINTRSLERYVNKQTADQGESQTGMRRAV